MPHAILHVHVDIPQVGPKVNTVGGRHLVRIDACGRRRSSESRGGRTRNLTHAQVPVRSDGGRLRWISRRSEWLAERGGHWRRERIDKRSRWGKGLVQVQRSWPLWELPLGRLGRKVDVVVLSRFWVHVSDPALGQRWWGRRARRAWRHVRCLRGSTCLRALRWGWACPGLYSRVKRGMALVVWLESHGTSARRW